MAEVISSNANDSSSSSGTDPADESGELPEQTYNTFPEWLESLTFGHLKRLHDTAETMGFDDAYQLWFWCYRRTTKTLGLFSV